MKYLVLLVVLVVAYMLWRNARLARREEQARRPPPAAPAPGGPQDMIRCPVCSVHLPRADAVADARGALYCSQEHRLLGGD